MIWQDWLSVGLLVGGCVGLALTSIKLGDIQGWSRGFDEGHESGHDCERKRILAALETMGITVQISTQQGSGHEKPREAISLVVDRAKLEGFALSAEALQSLIKPPETLH